MIKYDSRETQTENGRRRLRQLKKLMLNSELKQGHFEAGDYILSVNEQNVIIETKEFSEMVHSMDNGRLATQLNRCRETGESWLIREGNVAVGEDCHTMYYQNKKINHTFPQIMNRLVSHMRCGTMILQSATPEQTGYLIYYLHQYYSKDSHDSANLRQYLSDEPNLSPQEAALTAAVGIGPDAAKKLISFAGNIDELCYYDYDELLEIDGIGEERARAVWKLLHDYQRKES